MGDYYKGTCRSANSWLWKKGISHLAAKKGQVRFSVRHKNFASQLEEEENANQIWGGGVIIYQKSGKETEQDLANGTIVTEGPHCALVECLLDGVYMWPCHGDKRNGAGFFTPQRESWVTNSLIEPQQPLELQATSATHYTVSFCTVSLVE